MKKLLLMLPFSCPVLFTQAVFGSFLAVDATLVSQTEQAILIVAGKVSDIHYVDYRGEIYTDVTMSVSKMLKGKPNIDEKTVRFRIEGGRKAVSGVRPFKLGQQLILFLKKSTHWLVFNRYDGLYPLMSRPYPQIGKVPATGAKIARFSFYFDKQEYRLNIPLDMTYRLIDAAIKAPDDVDSLEEQIRAIKAVETPENRGEWVEPKAFLLMLESELTKIEKKIKERERTRIINTPPPVYY